LLCRNLAIKEAKGKFITGLDDDDEFTKERVSLFIDEMG
jgi:glycosyltransferase involved in cell wall biosynthesis